MGHSVTFSDFPDQRLPTVCQQVTIFQKARLPRGWLLQGYRIYIIDVHSNILTSYIHCEGVFLECRDLMTPYYDRDKYISPL